MFPIPFIKLNPQIIPSQLEQMLTQHHQAIEEALKHDGVKKLLVLLNTQANQLEKFWSPVGHLKAVLGTDIWRECYQTCLPILTDHETWLYQHQDLYHQLKSDAQNLSVGEEKMLQDFLRACELSGIHLEATKRLEVKNIFERLDDLAQQFQNHIVDSMKAFRFHTKNSKDLEGLPAHVLANAKKKAEEAGKSGYILGLDQPTYMAVMSYAKNRDLRKLFFKAYGTRASDQSDYDGQKFDNTPLILEILQKRDELAKLLGFKDFAAYSLTTKMAKELHRVEHFLDLLRKQVKPITTQDVQTIKDFAVSKGYTKTLEPWDMAYFVQMRQQEIFSIDQEALRDYFPLTHVMQGVNQLLQALYGFNLEKVHSEDVWHEDVECYRLKQQEKIIGYIYCDWFSREGKQSGAWMDILQTRCQLDDGEIQYAMTTLTCNFAKPSPGKKAGLTHDELLTLLHELGHCLHHMLSEVSEFSVSGVHGVEWDAVELPSQWMENWAWVEDWVKIFSHHVKTGESLPHAIFEQLLKVKNDLIGLHLSRQILFGLYDIHIHSQNPPKNKDMVHQQYLDLLKEIAVWPVDWNQRFPQNFSHIFAGGYAAGYYSYLWADVLSSDAFEWFAEDLQKISEKGHRFKTEILAKGGAISALDAFIQFRGREPDQNALLRAYGLKVSE